jgi:hypothetical protein
MNHASKLPRYQPGLLLEVATHETGQRGGATLSASVTRREVPCLSIARERVTLERSRYG